MPGKKILIIDDNPVVVRMNEALLKSAGYEVVSAKSGPDGLSLAGKEIPDLILLDIILPGMHGFEVCRALKSDPRTCRIPVVIITGSGLEEVARNEPEIAAAGCLSKPYSLEELDRVIRKALNNSV